VSDLLLRLCERGWRLTAQRRVIAETLTGDHLHLTADEVLAAARDRLPEVGRATVYATLRELVELGELTEMTTDRGAVRYDPNVAAPHHHLVCAGCGEVLDVPSELPTLAAEHRHGFEIDAVEVTFRGRCPSCREHAPA
jgi:Fur family transcriptional regulator, stress-responsive regulator